MKKTNKKGFTIVELVIVIAVIAILAAVLIPNISRLVKKANESSDLSLVRNLNTALAVENKTYATAYEAFEAVKEAGYDLTKIEAKASDNKILFDSENQCFVYLNNNKLEYYPNSQKTALTSDEYYKLWAIETEAKTDGDYTYSVYWNGADNAEIKVNGVGFDAGEKTVKSVTYTGANEARNIVLRTTGTTTVSVDGYVAANNTVGDVIYHYGAAGNVNVEKCAMASYHETGTVETLTVTSGHVELTTTAKVSALVVETANKDKVKLSAKDGAQIVNAILPVGVLGGEEITAKADNKVDSSSDFLNITTVDKLNEALAQEGDYIYVRLGANIDAGNASVWVAPKGGNANITIDGNGYNLSSKSNRVLKTCNENVFFGGVLTISNLSIYANYDSSENPFQGVRAISLYNFKGTLNFCDSNIDNTIVDQKYDNYGIYVVTKDANNVRVNVIGSSIKAFQGVVVYGSNRTLNIDNCQLTSINQHNAGSHGGCIAIMEDSVVKADIRNTDFYVVSTEGMLINPHIQVRSVLGVEAGGVLKLENCSADGNVFAFENISHVTNIIVTINGVDYSSDN